MQKLVVALLLVPTILLAQTKEKAEKLGVVAELSYQKLMAEYYAHVVLNDSTIKDEDKQQFAKQYNATKTIYDQIILQLIADSKRKNSICYFKKINKVYTNYTASNITEKTSKHKVVSTYLANLKLANEVHTKLILKGMTIETANKNNLLGIKAFWPAAASVEELTGVLGFVTGTIASINESKGKKVDGITEVLEKLRLSSLQEIITPSE